MLENLIKFFLHNYRLNYTLTFFLMLAGFYAYSALPREMFPPFASDKIMISGAYPGASADNLDKMAVSDIEDQLRSIPAITKIESTIQSGFFSMIVELANGSDKSDTLNRIKDAIALSRPNLPSDMDEPIAQNVDIQMPLILVAISSQVRNGEAILNKDQLLSEAKEVRKRLAAIPNLSNVQLLGEAEKEIQIRIDSSKLKAYGLNAQEVASFIANLSYIFPLGTIETREAQYYLSTTYGKKDPQELLNTLVSVGGKRILMREFAEVYYGYGESSTHSSFNGFPSFTINISKDEKGNAIALSKRVKEEVERLKTAFPYLTFSISLDSSIPVSNRLSTVISNITLGFLLVGGCMWLLINKRIAFVVSLGIPFAFLLGALIFYILGYSLNLISLLGALIAVGILVDDAIIVSENIQRHIEQGKSPMQAAFDGTKEVILPVVVAAVTTICAFLPMFFIRGDVGTFAKLIPAAIVILIIASLLESFFFLPLHAAHTLSKAEKQRRWGRVLKMYYASLKWIFAWRKLAVTLFLVVVPILTIGCFIYAFMKYQLFTTFDGNEIHINGQLPSSYTLEETIKAVNGLEKEILSHKEQYFIRSTSAFSGFRQKGMESEQASNVFMVKVELEDAMEDNFLERYITPILAFDWFEERNEGRRVVKSFIIAKELNEKIQAYISDKDFVEFSVQSVQTGITDADIEISLIGSNEKVASALKRLKAEAEGLSGIRDVQDDLKDGITELKISINNYGESLGLNEGKLSAALSDSFLFAKRGKSLDSDGIVQIRIEDTYKDDLNTLKYFVVNTGEKQVLLKDVATITEQQTIERIKKQEGDRTRTLSINVNAEETNANSILSLLNPTLEEFKQQGIAVRLGGEYEQNVILFQDMIIASAVALSLIFITLLLMFNSLAISFAVLSVIPLSLLGAVLGHLIMGVNLSMTSLLGLLGLCGVVVNDGIVMLDFLRKAKNVQEFFANATKRLRPIMLTSITTFIGLATLIFFPSGQAVILQPLAICLGFGLAWGTVLNLYYLPLIYALIHQNRQSKPQRESLKDKILNKIRFAKRVKYEN
ncbi:efflux RND transporter permease subunit [Helicobacter monodelphidis]|uniref:efflux RND transporter permease subunit n=1 Tax=Helicobacter sp. 15-1451 TaxID=2004995 RepID=UPI0015EC046B|nr:efflux RND transporter permease subunit [Helicobacter sp. 15-1451]